MNFSVHTVTRIRPTQTQDTAGAGETLIDYDAGASATVRGQLQIRERARSIDTNGSDTRRDARFFSNSRDFLLEDRIVAANQGGVTGTFLVTAVAFKSEVDGSFSHTELQLVEDFR